MFYCFLKKKTMLSEKMITPTKSETPLIVTFKPISYRYVLYIVEKVWCVSIFYNRGKTLRFLGLQSDELCQKGSIDFQHTCY